MLMLERLCKRIMGSFHFEEGLSLPNCLSAYAKLIKSSIQRGLIIFIEPVAMSISCKPFAKYVHS